MADDLRGLCLIGNKSDKLVTAVQAQHTASGELSTIPLVEYVDRGIEPADGKLPWQEDISGPSKWFRRTAMTNRGPALTTTEVLPPPLRTVDRLNANWGFRMKLKLDSKRALVTGASAGLSDYINGANLRTDGGKSPSVN